MPKKRLPRSVRKFLRRKKAELRRQFLSSEEAEVKIKELVTELRRQYHGVNSNIRVDPRTVPRKSASMSVEAERRGLTHGRTRK